MGFSIEEGMMRFLLCVLFSAVSIVSARADIVTVSFGYLGNWAPYTDFFSMPIGGALVIDTKTDSFIDSQGFELFQPFAGVYQQGADFLEIQATTLYDGPIPDEIKFVFSGDSNSLAQGGGFLDALYLYLDGIYYGQFYSVDDSPVPIDVDSRVGAVPEPSTWAMLVIGFVGIGFAAYRRYPHFKDLRR